VRFANPTHDPQTLNGNQPSRFLPVFFAAAHRFLAANASRFRAAALIGFLLRLRRVRAAPSDAAGLPSHRLISPILTSVDT